MDMNVQPKNTTDAGDGLGRACGPVGHSLPSLVQLVKVKCRTLSIPRRHFWTVVGEDA